MSLFDIDAIAFSCWGYPLSFVELIGTLFGLVSVYYASKGNILTWPTGIISEVFLFLLFFQVQLYADMFLQLYFFFITVFGWYNWNKNISHGAVTSLTSKSRLVIIVTSIAATIAIGFIIKNIHLYLPLYFKEEAAY